MNAMKTELLVLDVNEGWPPVAKECMTCADCESGYRIEGAAALHQGFIGW